MRKGNTFKVDIVGENTKLRRLMLEAIFGGISEHQKWRKYNETLQLLSKP